MNQCRLVFFAIYKALFIVGPLYHIRYAVLEWFSIPTTNRDGSWSQNKFEPKLKQIGPYQSKPPGNPLSSNQFDLVKVLVLHLNYWGRKSLMPLSPFVLRYERRKRAGEGESRRMKPFLRKPYLLLKTKIKDP